MDNAAVIARHVSYLRFLNARPETIKHRYDNLMRLQRTLTVPLLDVTPMHLDEWQSRLTVSVSSIATYSSHVRSFYRWAYDEAELIPEDPARRLRVPKVRPRHPRPIPEQDLALALRTAIHNPRMFVWLCLAGYCGLRACEIAAITREDVIEEAGGAFLVTHGKGGKDRLVPIPQEVLEHLRSHLRGRGPVFRRLRTGDPMTANDITRLASEHLHGIGLPFTLHTLRHRFATALSAMGCDVRSIQELLGHASLSTTTGYIGYGARQAAASVTELGHDLDIKVLPRSPAA